MSHHPTMSSDAIAFSRAHRDALSSRVVRFVLDRYLLLPVGAAIALVWANADPERYFAFSHILRFPVNDIGMVLFFGLLTQEIIEEVMPGGALHTWRRWTMPVAGAIGGTIAAPVVFVLYVGLAHETVLAQTWPVACAVDIVAGYYVLRLIRPRRAVFAFAMLMAIAANGFAIAIIAPRQPVVEIQLAGALLIVAALGTAATMRALRVASFWPYALVSGTLSWLGFYLNGLQPALAAVPVVLFLPHEPRRLEDFPDTADDDATHHVEHAWNEVVQAILFLFGLVNAGVILRGYGTGTWALLTAVLVGRPLGAFAGVALTSAAGLRLPANVGWREVMVVALSASSGFTMALFFAVGAVPLGPVLNEIKIGALLSVIGAGLAVAAAAALGVGRFAHRHPRHPG
jgi:Na+:H+ antiporter, NhaA family